MILFVLNISCGNHDHHGDDVVCTLQNSWKLLMQLML